LLVSGPTVMLGYWGRPPQGDAPYATGDVVRLEADGNFVYVGRRDHMVKVRGHRVEPGEIEAALREHPRVRDVAVITHGAGLEARLVAFLVVDGEAMSPLEVKRHCADRVPRYMIVDKVRCVNELPRTSTGKVDRLALAQRFDAEHGGAR
jgi:acyl-coenzyme A synthetase/AMP-(fatty) acid ligase